MRPPGRRCAAAAAAAVPSRLEPLCLRPFLPHDPRRCGPKLQASSCLHCPGFRGLLIGGEGKPTRRSWRKPSRRDTWFRRNRSRANKASKQTRERRLQGNITTQNAINQLRTLAEAMRRTQLLQTRRVPSPPINYTPWHPSTTLHLLSIFPQASSMQPPAVLKPASISPWADALDYLGARRWGVCPRGTCYD